MEESAVESTEETNEKKTVWDYYNKCISDDGSKRAQCIICKNVYSYNSTVFNLKSHLYHIHKDVIGDLELSYNGNNRKVANKTRGSRARTSKLWEHFSIVEDEYKIANCNYCQRRISFKSTSCNLKSHLARLHPAVHAKYVSTDRGEDETSEEEITIPYDDESEEEESKLTQLSAYFERETGGRARCRVCRASVPHRRRELARHLADHPKLLHDQDSDVQLQDDDQETYTEVVYLEDTKPSDAKKKTKWPTNWRPEDNAAKTPKYSKRKIKRRVSSSSDEPIVKKKKEDREIRKFGEYIICLLEKLPRDVCMKMQMNIVNTIMNANLSNTVPVTNPLANTVPVTNPLANTVPIVQSVPVNVPTSAISTEYIVLDKNHSEKSLLQNTGGLNVPAAQSGIIVLDENHSEKSLLQNASGTGSSNLNPSYSITIAPSSVVEPNAVSIANGNEIKELNQD